MLEIKSLDKKLSSGAGIAMLVLSVAFASSSISRAVAEDNAFVLSIDSVPETTKSDARGLIMVRLKNSSANVARLVHCVNQIGLPYLEIHLKRDGQAIKCKDYPEGLSSYKRWAGSCITEDMEPGEQKDIAFVDVDEVCDTHKRGSYSLRVTRGILQSNTLNISR